MAYYRRRYRRRLRRNRRYRRMFKRRMYKYSRSGQKVQLFTRWMKLNPITGTTGTTETSFGQSFKLNQLPNWTEFQNLYDEYKIKAVKFTLIPASNVTLYSSAFPAITDQTLQSNKYFTCFDYNDVTTISADAIRQYATCKMTTGTRLHKRFIYPRVTTAVAEGSGAYGTATSMRQPWINMASNDTQFFGIKGCITHPTLPQNIQFCEVECKFYMMFRNPK
ncbi:capsid [uncultured virus]|uniref:Capsid n=1 Tax=uncultured virus TaxID=340016 RepID=A0A2K9LSR3_9VIRU|nr:capsid [uncultured virus]